MSSPCESCGEYPCDESCGACDYPREAACPMCCGAASLLGVLGLLQWYRCEDCGIDFNRQTKDKV